MFTHKLSLTVGLLIFIPLFGMQTDSVLRKVRGNSSVIKIAIEKLDSPVGSKPQTPNPLEPREIGDFDDKCTLSDNENDQDFVLEIVKREETKPKTEIKISKADLSSNWRNDPRSQPGFENRFSQAQRPTSPYKKSSSRPTNISTNCRASTQPLVTILHPKPLVHNKTTTRTSQELTPKASYAIYTPPAQDTQELAVVASAAKLYNKQLSSNNPFSHLSEEQS